jgi:hypothetical protein
VASTRAIEPIFAVEIGSTVLGRVQDVSLIDPRGAPVDDLATLGALLAGADGTQRGASLSSTPRGLVAAWSDDTPSLVRVPGSGLVIFDALAP